MFYHVCECMSFKSQDIVDDVGTGALESSAQPY